ncbi:uncharacterized protein [Apostichopus japonicus]|uniref:uncharacterized protein isoform X3 n=1 Tax=Stichopus japonicus TaxID=307972 RepID=UPI003AB4F673
MGKQEKLLGSESSQSSEPDSVASSPGCSWVPSSAGSSPAAVIADWAESFKVDWDKMPKSLTKSLQKKQRPTPKDRREMIRILCNDIMKVESSPGRKHLSIIAQKIVCEFPEPFKNDIEGLVVGSGYASLLTQLENRMSNINRGKFHLNVGYPLFVEGEQNEALTKKRKLSTSYGCKNWQPEDLPEGEDRDTQRKKIDDLKVMHELNIWDDNEVVFLMKTVFPTIRAKINSQQVPVRALLDEYPFLFEEVGMMGHFEDLVGIKLKSVLTTAFIDKSPRIQKFLQVSAKKKKEVQNIIADVESAKKESGDHSPDVPGLILLLCNHLGDKWDDLFYLAKETSTVQNITKDLKSTSPCIIIQGPNMYTGRKFMLAVDMVIVNDHIQTFESAMTMLFAMFFILNIEYPSKGATLMEFIQRCFVGLNPEKGRKTPKSKKSYPVNPKILALVGNLKEFESDWTV